MLELGDPEIPGCKNNQSYSEIQSEGVLGCGWGVSYPYFISFILIVRLTILNLLLAVVIEGFRDAKKENDAVINPAEIDEFLEKWAQYDPKGTGLIRPEELLFILHDLHSPIGLKEANALKYNFNLDCKLSFILSHYNFHSEKAQELLGKS